jgi:hypothetical protein
MPGTSRCNRYAGPWQVLSQAQFPTYTEVQVPVLKYQTYFLCGSFPLLT